MKRKKLISILVLVCLFFSGCEKRDFDRSAGDETGKEVNSVRETDEDGFSGEDQETNDSVSNDDESESQAQSQEPFSRDVFAMDTYMTVTAYGDSAQNAVDEAVAEIERLDGILSTGDENSEVFALNQQGGGTVSEDTQYLLERSLEIWKDTDGVFEIGIYPVMQAWGFTSGNYRVPSAEELEELLLLADSSLIRVNPEESSVSFAKKGMEINLGGIAKGYTSSRIMDIFRDNGVTSGLVSLGGNVQVLGVKPDGSKWRVAIQDPSGGDGYLGILETENCAVITSGGYERYFEEDGVTYHHIIDPSTGYPADSGLVSVSIVSADGTLADGLSTALFIMGREKAEAFWREHSDEFDVIMLDEDGVLCVTEGIADEFTSDLEVRVLKTENEEERQ